jgi:hypothetical protein
MGKLGLQDFCRTMRQINTSASNTVRSANFNPMDAHQTCCSCGPGIWKSVEMCREVNISSPQKHPNSFGVRGPKTLLDRYARIGFAGHAWSIGGATCAPTCRPFNRKAITASCSLENETDPLSELRQSRRSRPAQCQWPASGPLR